MADEWTEEEINASVVAYLAMLRNELDGQSYVKSAINQELRDGPLASRTKSAVEYRMQNISSVLWDTDRPWIAGYLPASNVGQKVKVGILKAIDAADTGFLSPYSLSDDPDELEARAKALAETDFVVPKPKRAPPRKTTTTTSFVRDPLVVVAVRDFAKGICELCQKAGPFLVDDQPFLEVHHVHTLAAGGFDSVDNAAAVCPNCHRRCHYANDAEACTERLYEQVDRLERMTLT